MAAAPFQQLELSLDARPEEELPDRLRRLGLRPGVPVTLTRNRTVLLSFDAGRGLRLHAGYAWAPDHVLQAILRFVAPRATRAERLRARRVFLAFPVERHAPVRPRRARPAEPAEHAPLIAQLERLHAILNERHFGGRLGTIPVRLSTRMERRLGEFEATHDGRAVAITLSRRHLDRDGWSAATETLLHEMVHQWQCENGMPLDHGRAFRQKARAVGIPPAATVRADTLSASSRPGTIA
ncbi:MAG: SprT-like domain-containing protein [Gemmatimonadetes bacterium]|nr:SprT-like domain-containing protein [Gemmatimonadota bacterium]MCB9518404.1 SprT-like domain-containing protein [Gemmatimonadales bacterium]MCA9762603.1 SprT-like domain-containing protein [Gemmatimonadota bacterium]MCA9769206.1 SprT-like domain-containing protein [Gemmatimonadota bacterium]HPF61773.1 SprT-like domain-containing protein [Gemmatimonadales bacterium]